VDDAPLRTNLIQQSASHIGPYVTDEMQLLRKIGSISVVGRV
jgi:hypothetical protein